MILTKSTVAKLSVAFVAASMLFAFVSAPAKAQTVEELQAQINALLAQISALQAGTTTTTTTSCSSIMPPLTIGSTGASVTALQNYLIGAGESIPAGATGYFGTQTQAALAAWQAANGVSPAAGYYGPITQGVMDAQCAAMMAAQQASTGSTGGTTDTTGSTSTTSTDTTTTPSTPALTGYADLKSATLNSADNTTVEEGATNATIGTITLNFQNGDARIDRLDLGLSHVSGSTNDPWNAFSNVSLWVDGAKVADMNTDSRGDYLDYSTTAHWGTLRFSGLNITGMEGEDVVVTVKANLEKNNNNTNDWSLTAEGTRYFDAQNVATTENGLGDFSGDTSGVAATGDPTADFTIDTAGAQDNITVKPDSSNPTAQTLEVKDNATSDWYTVLVYDLDTKDSVNDITLNNLYATVTVSTGTYNTFVSDAELVVDGTTISSSASDVTGGTTATGVIHFDATSDNVVINAGDRVTAELRLKFKSMTNTAYEGATVTASANSNTIDATGADDLTSSQLSGSASGKAQTLRTKGISADGNGGADNSAVLTAATLTGTHDYVTYTIKYDVTAFNQDLYISKTAATSLAYELTDGSGTGLGTTTNTSVDSYTSTADDTVATGYYYVPEGSTESFTLVIKWTPGGASASRGIQLDSIKYAATAVAPTDTWTAVPTSDYRTTAVSTNN